MSPVNSMFVCIKKKKISANLFLKWPISIIGKMLNIGADNRSTPTTKAIRLRLQTWYVSCLDSHSDGSHSLQMIHWWTINAMLNFSKSVLMKKLNNLYLEWPDTKNALAYDYYKLEIIFYSPLDIQNQLDWARLICTVCRDLETNVLGDIFFLSGSAGVSVSSPSEIDSVNCAFVTGFMLLL